MNDQERYHEAKKAREAIKGSTEFKLAVVRFIERSLQDAITLLRYKGERELLKKVCKHPPEFNKYHPDPSGNNDSWHECLICGEDF